MKWAKPFSLPFLFHFLLETVKVAFFLESFSSEGEREKKSGNGGNRLIEADLLLAEAAFGDEISVWHGRYRPTRFREFRYNISRLSARSSSSQSCRNSLLNRRNYARPIRVNRESSWIFRNLVTFFFFPATPPTLPSRYFTFQTRVTRVLYIIGPVDIFLKYFSSFVYDIVYIFNVIPLRIKYSSMYCFSGLKRFFHSLSTKFPLNSRHLFGNLNRSSTIYFVYAGIVYRQEGKTRENIYICYKERLWRQLYLLRSNQGWNFLKFHISIERIRVRINSGRVYRSKYVKLKAPVDWLHRVQP